MMTWITKRLVSGAQKAVTAALTAGAVYLTARWPLLAPVLTGETLATIQGVAIEATGLAVSMLVGYAATWWKANRA